jgi:hypothetical protein
VYAPPQLHLSAAECTALAPFLQALNQQPFYMFSEIEGILQRISFCLTDLNQDYIQALKSALTQANEKDYQQLLKELNHACSTG